MQGQAEEECGLGLYVIEDGYSELKHSVLNRTLDRTEGIKGETEELCNVGLHNLYPQHETSGHLCQEETDGSRCRGSGKINKKNCLRLRA